MPVTATTELPDANSPTLGNGVEDEIEAETDDNTDNGDFRFQIRETGQSAWDSSATGFAEAVVASDLDTSGTVSTIFAGLEDGEEYEVRVRTETADVIGAWTSPVAITTVFPGATQLTVTSVGQTTVDLEFQDNADNEDGVYLERRELFQDGFGEWRRLEDLGANTGTGTVTATDGQVLPNTTYEYRVIPYTEHSSATSSSVETTTVDDGVRTDRVAAEGWHVVVEDQDGNQIEPAIVGTPTYRPTLNGLPTVEVPVAEAARWEDTDAWERQPMRVYLDGERKPIERLEQPRQETDRTILVGKGGVELEELVERDVVEEDAHLVAEDIIQTTPYTAHVDDPASDTEPDVLLETVDSESEWDGAVGNPAADALWETDGNGRLRSRQTAHFEEAEDADTLLITDSVSEANSNRWSGGQVVRITDAELNGTYAEVSETFTTDHAIPSSDLGAAIRLQFPGDGHHAFEVRVDGTVVDTVAADALAGGETEPDWFDAAAGGDLADPIPAGNHTLTLKVTSASSASDPRIFVDCLSLYDNRSAPNLTSQVSDNVLTGPDLRPNAVDVETADVTTVRQVIGGGLSITANSTANGQAIALSNDQGGTFPISGSNTQTIDGTFADGSSTLRARFTLSGFDDAPDTSPAGRKVPTEVDLYELSADLDDTPILVNRGLSGSALEVLNQIAELDAIWEVVWDSSTGSIAVEWTAPGQRTATVDPSLVNYSVETDYGSVVRKARIKGTLVPVEEQEITAQYNAWVGLGEPYLEETGEIVRATDGTVYERGQDYELRPNQGSLQALSTGAISDGETLVVDYRYHIVGEYEAPDFDGSTPVLEETLPAVTTQRSAEQAALIAVKTASKPIQTASVTIDRELGVSLVEAIDVEQLPTREPLETWSVDTSPQSVALQLGSRNPVDETLSRLNSRLRTVSQKL